MRGDGSRKSIEKLAEAPDDIADEGGISCGGA